MRDGGGVAWRARGGPSRTPSEGAWRREPGAGLRGKARVEPGASRLVELKKDQAGDDGREPRSSRGPAAPRVGCIHPQTHVRTRTGYFEKSRREGD